MRLSTTRHAGGRSLVLIGLIATFAVSLLLEGCGPSSRTRRVRRPRPEVATQPTSIFDTSAEEGAVTGTAPADDPGKAPSPDAGPLPVQPIARPTLVQDEDRGTSAPIRNPTTPDEVLSALGEDQKVLALEAEYQKRLGDDAYERSDYVEAERRYERALELNPLLIEARERLQNARVILGKRAGQALPVAKALSDERRAEQEQRLFDARRGIVEAKELMVEGDLESLRAAERKLAKIADELSTFEYPVDISGELAETRALLDEVGKLEAQQELVERSKKEAIIQEEMDRLRAEQERQREKRVEELTLKAADYIRFHEYDKAIQACEQILKIDPHHQVAQFWLRESTERRVDRRHADLLSVDREQLAQNRESLQESGIPWVTTFTFPEDKEWTRIQKRKEQLQVIQADDPEPIRKIKSDLETTEVSFEFQQTPLVDVVAFLRQVTGINIDIDPEVLEEDEHTVDLTVQNMKARNALNLILLQTDLAYTFQEQILYITKKEKARGLSDFVIYNVSDILNKIRDFKGPELKLRAPGETDEAGAGGIDIAEDTFEDEAQLDPETLEQLIKDSTGGEEIWGDEDLYNMEYHRGLLLVNAPRDLHLDIQRVLENLREDSDLFVMIEARFIDVTDDFLEDIGVDARALGVVNNLGTPFGNVINDSRTGGNDIGFVKQGSPVRDVTLIMGQDRWAGRIQHIIDGFTGLISGDRIRGGSGVSGLTVQSTWLDPFQLNAILRAVQEKSDVRQLTAPTITAHNGERVYVSVITQRAYIADYELVSGGTGFSIIEVADPIVATFQEGVILDVDPVISPDKKYITLDVRPTMATLIGGVISTILISLGSFTNVAFQVPIGVPEVSLQQTFTSVTVPNGGTVLLGGFKSLNEAKYTSYLPILGKIPIIKNLFRRKAELSEKRSLVILITARIINPRHEEELRFGTN